MQHFLLVLGTNESGERHLIHFTHILLTAQIGLNAITSNDNTTTGQTLAVITMVTIPVIIIYSLFSKQIVEGVISTGSKEG